MQRHMYIGLLVNSLFGISLNHASEGQLETHLLSDSDRKNYHPQINENFFAKTLTSVFRTVRQLCPLAIVFIQTRLAQANCDITRFRAYHACLRLQKRQSSPTFD